MKAETKALRFIQNGDVNLRSVVRTLEKMQLDLEDKARCLGFAIQEIEDQAGGIIAAKEILEEIRKK